MLTPTYLLVLNKANLKKNKSIKNTKSPNCPSDDHKNTGISQNFKVILFLSKLFKIST